MTGLMKNRNVKNEILKEVELTEPLVLCDSEGRLKNESVGWSRKPIHTCNIRGHKMRKKKWNYWRISNDKYLINIILSNFDYVGFAFVYFLDIETKKFIEKTVKIPFGKGCLLKEKVNDDIHFIHKKINLSIENNISNTNIHLKWFEDNDEVIKADFLINHPETHETLNVVIPWSKKKFHFTSKQNCLPAKGKVTIGNNSYNFKSNNSYACLDFGRGDWPYSGFWNWASFSGVATKGSKIGLNLGAGWTDGTGLTENAILVNGRINKISENVIFSYDKSKLMNPWSIRTANTDRIDIRFTPIYNKRFAMNRLVAMTRFVKLFGYFSGRLVTEEGEIVNFENIVGTAEEQNARW